MKHHLRTFALVLTVILAVCLFALPVMADTTTGGGLELALTTDKAEYTAEEQIVATLSAKNTTEAAITNLVARHIAPKGFDVAGGEAKKSVDSLAAGESVTLEVTYKKGNPATGDYGVAAVAAAMVLTAAGLIALAATDKKTGRNVIAVFLCCVMVAGLAVGVSADELTDGITVSTTVKVDGANVTISATVSQNAAEEPTEPADPVVYNGMTASELDAIPCITTEEFQSYMDVTWNFGWEGNATIEHNATKADFDGTAPVDSKIWRLGTVGEEGTASIINAGWGVQLWTKGAGNVAYMYSKLDVPATATQFRIWAVGLTNEHWSGSGAIRAVALYKDENGNWVKEILRPIAETFTGNKTTVYNEADGTTRFSNAQNWSIPDVQDGCMLIYNMDNLKGREDVVIFVESVGIGNVLGTAATEEVGGVPNGSVMPENLIVKRVMFL